MVYDFYTNHICFFLSVFKKNKHIVIVRVAA